MRVMLRSLIVAFVVPLQSHRASVTAKAIVVWNCGSTIAKVWQQEDGVAIGRAPTITSRLQDADT